MKKTQVVCPPNSSLRNFKTKKSQQASNGPNASFCITCRLIGKSRDTTEFCKTKYVPQNHVKMSLNYTVLSGCNRTSTVMCQPNLTNYCGYNFSSNSLNDDFLNEKNLISCSKLPEQQVDQPSEGVSTCDDIEVSLAVLSDLLSNVAPLQLLV